MAHLEQEALGRIGYATSSLRLRTRVSAESKRRTLRFPALRRGCGKEMNSVLPLYRRGTLFPTFASPTAVLHGRHVKAACSAEGEKKKKVCPLLRI